MLYFAYGSNMDPNQMIERCPDAKLVGLACLPDHILCFPRRSKNRGCGVSSIEPKIGHDTWGVVWELSEADLVALDKNEGFRRDRDPTANAYNRLSVRVNLDSEWLETQTYIASPQDGRHLPNAAYLAHLRDGAAHHGLPEVYRTYLAGLSEDSSA
ncbi:gamma-glutamylcyclotransferase [Agrobacterium tumefaciens]|uniref:gamma-glutamylcyclotransferase family protein n=1 Tax=Agrobacterium tumefaciens TaxID=358 RepID=UPI001572D397|nr:gamma-glutamylcyclotransferase family protein [Agrobacterium tumefaciens]MCZ7497295.1 gamma-glutamylcyclotransferase [Rhizobium rhizogenes]NTE56510.1 gamma-glutamylcyclotransferase [Agrobacterium tumefaciens]NTE74478.1 gamma-glutamylcyclotransferase [Agrobacterium tumefaciens]